LSNVLGLGQAIFESGEFLAEVGQLGKQPGLALFQAFQFRAFLFVHSGDGW
jgi:hypothetical protein